MLIRRALALALAALALDACSQAQKNAYEHVGQPSIPKSSISSITFSRLGCYGGCPVYTLTFSRGDAATYDGKFYVDKIGKYSGEIDFELVAAWLDSQDVDDYAGEFGTNVADAERVELEISRTNRTIVIYSGYTGSLPVRVRGVLASMDGFADGVRWKPSSAIDSYLGYFLSDSTPDKLYAMYLVPGKNAVDASGYSHVTLAGNCASYAVANRLKIRLHLIGSHAIVRGRSYGHDVDEFEFGPEIPLKVVSEPDGLTVGLGTQQRSYHRVTWREYQSEDSALYKRCHPTN